MIDTTEQTTTAAAVGAFLSTPSRIMAKNSAAAATAVVLTPQEISQKVASMLKPGPPFYSTVSSADLIDNLANGMVMRCDGGAALQPKNPTTMKRFTKALTGKTGDDDDEAATTASEATFKGDVWSALESLPSGPAAWMIPSSHEASLVTINAADQHADDDGLWSSIMFTCDVSGEKVQLAKSCVVPTHVLNAHNYYAGNRSALFTTIGAGTTYQWDDFSSPSALATYSNSIASLYTFPSVEAWSLPSWIPFFGQPKDASKPAAPAAPSPPPPDKKGSKRVWVPSTEHVSVRASWWGYTIFLPRAVLPALSADVDQAEKIANIVYKVLTVILDNAGKLPLPMALQAAVLLLKAIAPATSYISTFIGWSWDEIMSFDKGQGVELSATWLLPIALIPHTWDAAIAPDDKNKDGKPDGPPVKEPTPAPPTAPAEGEKPGPVAPAPKEPEKPAQKMPETPAKKEPDMPAAPSEPVPSTPAVPSEPVPSTPATPAEPVATVPAVPTEPLPTTPAAPAKPTPSIPAAPVEPLPPTPAEPAPAPAPSPPAETTAPAMPDASPATPAVPPPSKNEPESVTSHEPGLPAETAPEKEACDTSDEVADSIHEPSVKEVEENLERADKDAEVQQPTPGPIVQSAAEPAAQPTVQSVSSSSSYDSSATPGGTTSAKGKGKAARKLLGKITNRT